MPTSVPTPEVFWGHPRLANKWNTTVSAAERLAQGDTRAKTTLQDGIEDLWRATESRSLGRDARDAFARGLAGVINALDPRQRDKVERELPDGVTQSVAYQLARGYSITLGGTITELGHKAPGDGMDMGSR